MKIRWYGHSCFLITTDSGLRILTDPFDETVGYSLPGAIVDIVTVSHEHFDHNAVELLSGNFDIVRGPGDHNVRGLTIHGLATYHDDVYGAKRGDNTIYTFEADGLRITHLGDLGHTLSASQIMALRPINVLMIPVGGFYTIDAEQAKEVAQTLNPDVIIPMHYKTPVMDLPIAPVDDFLNLMGTGKRLHATTIEIFADNLPPHGSVIVLDYL